MYKAALFTFLIIIAVSCRKDDSVSLPVSSGVACLVTKAIWSNGDVTTMKYELDSIPVENIESNSSNISNYLVIENPKQFLYYKGGKTPDKLATRIYMNDFGSVQKEVAVSMSSDGKTIIENQEEMDVYHYNNKKLLVKIEKGYGDVGVIDLTYDSKNRINHVVIKDTASEMVFFEYTDFKYLDRQKNDNYGNIGFTDSYSLNLIPCLRNVYITSYTLKTMPGMLDFESVYTNEFKFNGNTLSQVKAALTAFGESQSLTVNYEVSCK